MKSLTSTQRAKLQTTLHDPVEYVRTWLKSDTWDTQEQILRSVAVPHSKTIVRSCHSSGKTFISAAAALWFLARHSEAIIVTTAPTSKQLEKILWSEVRTLLQKSAYPYPESNLTDLRIGPKRYITGFTTSVQNQDGGVRFQGFHADHILFIIDEAPGIDPAIWNAIEGARAGGDVRILALGNPTIASGPFHSAFHEGRESWKRFTISAFDTPNFDGISLTYLAENGIQVKLGTGNRDLQSLSEEELDQNPRPYLTTRRWVKERFAEWGPGNPLWESRVCGAFPAQSEFSLLSLVWLEQAKARRTDGTGGVTAGLDVAGPGEDETVLTLRRGCEILSIQSWPSSDPHGDVVAALRPYKADLEAVNVDSIGIGWGMYQHLMDLGFNANPINVGEAALDPEKYANRKAELYWGLRMRLESGDMSGSLDDKTIGQLAGIRYKHNPRGQVLIESKDEARKRGVKSPDRAESVMLAFVSDSSMDVWIRLGAF